MSPYCLQCRAITILAALALAESTADRIVLSECSATLSALETISRRNLPTFTLKGDIADLFGSDRAVVNRLVGTMARAVSNACPNVGALIWGPSRTGRKRRDDRASHR